MAKDTTAAPSPPPARPHMVGPTGRIVRITGVPVQHGPDGTGHLTGEVTGFVLTGDQVPATYISGDKARVDPDVFRDAPQGQIRADPDRRGQPAAAVWDMSTTTAT